MARLFNVVCPDCRRRFQCHYGDLRHKKIKLICPYCQAEFDQVSGFFNGINRSTFSQTIQRQSYVFLNFENFTRRVFEFDPNGRILPATLGGYRKDWLIRAVHGPRPD